jgi:hypothetical protein
MDLHADICGAGTLGDEAVELGFQPIEEGRVLVG